MKDHSRFYSSLGLLILLNTVIKPLWIFGIDRQVQNMAGTAPYGVYFSVMGLSVVLGFMLDLGITTFFNRQLASGERGASGKTASILRIKLILAIMYAAVVILIAWLSGVTAWSIVFSIIGIQVLSSFFLFFRAIITAQQWFGTDAWLSVLDKTLMIIFCGSFILFPAIFGQLGIQSFLWLQLAATLLAVMAVLFILISRKFQFRLAGGTGLTKKDFGTALPFALIVLLMGAHNRLDGFLLERLRPDGAYQAGIYAGAYRLLDAVNMAGYLMASFLLPFIARKQSQHENFNDVVLNSRHILVSISIGVSFTAIYLAPQIQSLLYHSNDANAILVLQTCLPSLVGYALIQVYGTVLTATGHIRTFCLIVLATLILNIALNLLFIPQYGAYGSCLAALISQSICGLATVIACSQKPGVPAGFRSVIIYTIMAFLLYIYFYGMMKVQLNAWLVAAGAGLLIALIVFVSGLARPSKIKMLILQIKNK